MKTPPWRRDVLIDALREDVWRYLTPAAEIEQQLLEASALLRMPPEELRDVSQLQFLTSGELGQLLSDLPGLLRRLATTTTAEEEWRTERVRGNIAWGKTISLRAATGLPHLYITAPAQRAYQTPENELLVFVLDATVALGRRTGWLRGEARSVGRLLSERVATAQRALQARTLSQVIRTPVTPRQLARIRAGRFRRRYGSTLSTYDIYQRLVARLDRAAIRRAVENHGLVTRDDATLFELLCTFRTIAHIHAVGWRGGTFHLMHGGLRLRFHRGDARLDLHYQHTPSRLQEVSIYGRVQNQHQIPRGGFIPDLVLQIAEGGKERFVLVEVKGGPKRRVSDSARAALQDLLAYRRAFEKAFKDSSSPYGIGVAWGAELMPSPNAEIVLATPDTLDDALAHALS